METIAKVRRWVKADGISIKEVVWTCRVLVPLQLLIYAAFLSKAKGLFQPRAECFRRAL